jgi:pentatricopeptide repeat protein
MPEVLWKSYIDFLVEEHEWEKARKLYERLLQRTEHVKVTFINSTTNNIYFNSNRSGYHLQSSNP